MKAKKSRANVALPPAVPTTRNPKLAQQRRTALRTHYAAKYRARMKQGDYGQAENLAERSNSWDGAKAALEKAKQAER